MYIFIKAETGHGPGLRRTDPLPLIRQVKKYLEVFKMKKLFCIGLLIVGWRYFSIAGPYMAAIGLNITASCLIDCYNFRKEIKACLAQ